MDAALFFQRSHGLLIPLFSTHDRIPIANPPSLLSVCALVRQSVMTPHRLGGRRLFERLKRRINTIDPLQVKDKNRIGW